MRKMTKSGIPSKGVQQDCEEIVFRIRKQLCSARTEVAENWVEEAVRCIQLVIKQDEFDSLNPNAAAKHNVTFELGQLVLVSSRMFRGSNKEGGVGTITAQHENGTVDVKYTLGGKENDIPVHFVKPYVIEQAVSARRRGAQPRKRCKTDMPDESKSHNPVGEVDKTSLMGLVDALEIHKQYRISHWNQAMPATTTGIACKPLPFTVDWNQLESDFRTICVNALGRYGKDEVADETGSPYNESLRLLQLGIELLSSSKLKSEQKISELLRQDAIFTEEVYFRLGKTVLQQFPFGSQFADSPPKKERSNWIVGAKQYLGMQQQFILVDLDFVQIPSIQQPHNNKKRKYAKNGSVRCQVKWPISHSFHTPISPAHFCDQLVKNANVSVKDSGFLQVSITAQLAEYGVTW